MSLPRILIADDHGPFRAMLRLILTSQGAQIVECDDGLEALRQFDALPMDWVLMDIEMPGLDGLELQQALTFFRCASRIPSCSSAPARSHRHCVTQSIRRLT